LQNPFFFSSELHPDAKYRYHRIYTHGNRIGREQRRVCVPEQQKKRSILLRGVFCCWYKTAFYGPDGQSDKIDLKKV
ncbi:MAG: hypothetical protein IKA32_11100, partial [Lentisphaeria bacterium]|nr:hypothetical protein [Lentisphaeria bacterium]